MTFEGRFFTRSELRMDSDGWIFGAVPYSSFSRPLWDDVGRFKECFLPVAFSIEGPVPLLREHAGSPLATTEDGSLQISNSEKFLKFRAALPPNEYTFSLMDALDAKALQVSPGFRVRKDSWTTSRGERLRIISSAELIELSLVGAAAYRQSCAVSNLPLERYKPKEHRVRFHGAPLAYSLDKTKLYLI